MTTYDLTTFGEAQIRLTVPMGDRLATCRGLRLTPAGSEANVAGLLAQLGRRAAFAGWTRSPVARVAGGVGRTADAGRPGVAVAVDNQVAAASGW